MKPSDLLDVEDPYLAYCVDEAVAYFGNWITSELSHVEGKSQKDIEARQESMLKRLLAPRFEQRFATPQATI